jgi:hypothetical protein
MMWPERLKMQVRYSTVAWPSHTFRRLCTNAAAVEACAICTVGTTTTTRSGEKIGPDALSKKYYCMTTALYEEFVSPALNAELS